MIKSTKTLGIYLLKVKTKKITTMATVELPNFFL